MERKRNPGSRDQLCRPRISLRSVRATRLALGH